MRYVFLLVTFSFLTAQTGFGQLARPTRPATRSAVNDADSTAPPRFILGRVLDLETGRGVAGASVINGRSRAMSRTNDKGAYYLDVKPGDSVIVSSASHGRTAFFWDGRSRHPELKLQRQFDEKVIQLEAVTVRARREAELKQELAAILSEPEARKGLSPDEILNLAQSPITLLYELFSKQARQGRKAAMISQQHRKHMLADYRLELIVLRATDLKGDDVDRFKQFCNFNDDFVLQASEYDLTYAVLQRQKRFQ